jgi:cold shock protein
MVHRLNLSGITAVKDTTHKQNKMPSGTVKFFNETKGFGFIKSDESNQDIFVHVSGLVDEIRENDKVTFEVEEGRKGLNAVNVERAS